MIQEPQSLQLRQEDQRLIPRLPDPFPDEIDLPPVDDINNDPADRDEFDETYLAKRGDWNIGGSVSSPAPYPLQVLPRVAYTINFNLVYNESRERWEPDTGNGDPGASGARAFQAAGTGQSLNGTNNTTVSLTADSYDNKDETDLGNNQITVAEDGLYYIRGSVTLEGLADGDRPLVTVAVNGSNFAGTQHAVSNPSGTGYDPDIEAGDIRRLSAGDAVSLVAGEGETGGHPIVGGETLTALTTVKVGP